MDVFILGEIPEAEKVYNEESWTDPESTTIDAYTKSKAVAEKAAWDFVKELPGQWRMHGFAIA